MINKKIKTFTVILSTTLLLSGCGSSNNDLKKYIAEVNARKTGQIPPIPQIKQYESFQYVATNKRDPYEPKQNNQVAPDTSRDKEPLEAFPLDSLKMIGRVDYHKVLYAMIKAPDAIIYQVKVGNYMGQNYGKIVEIKDNMVILTETVDDGSGNFITRPADIEMQQEKPDKKR